MELLHAVNSDAEETPLADERANTYEGPERRLSELETTTLRADAGISMLWRWGNMLVTLIGFGVMLGTFYAKFGSIEDKIAELFKQGDSMKQYTRQSDLDHLELQHQAEVIKDLKQQNTELRTKMDNYTDQRTAYVWSAAQRVLNGQKSAGLPPP